ncbi:hypothetical protein L226DRAFT_539750 [Lentinus tigrinus ALCF2SS1-7]|uniref:Uncharacterized protein n=1 Tax=Lentinus tigrinus ALCF2SS1-6 TaxID=1328759 RepID=A0A5C2SAY2_9APHY|nr:hypothetical protein L227DRAFT_575380 [Lentinus tigrinus ALCF2SS1-6]RPD69566.1 hypothetical protein L226DRAFT_539750 [Lentinus tigrinus ALCF2SS1-7]
MTTPRRRRGRRHQHPTGPPESSPQPIEVERKYCEAVLDEDDKACYFQPLCTVLLPMHGPRLCRRHTRECAESCRLYKDASRRMEALQPRVLEFSRRNKRGGFHLLHEVAEAFRIMDEFIFWADLELRERRGHTRFYAFVGSDPGHEKRMINVDKHMGIARKVQRDLRLRMYELQAEARRSEQREEAGRRGRARQQRWRSASPEEEQRVVRCFAMRVIRPDEEESDSEQEELEEVDDSALEEMMDEEELRADERTEREILEMLQWYSRSESGVSSVVGRTRDRDDCVDMLAYSTRNLDVMAPD